MPFAIVYFQITQASGGLTSVPSSSSKVTDQQMLKDGSNVGLDLAFLYILRPDIVPLLVFEDPPYRETIASQRILETYLQSTCETTKLYIIGGFRD